ASATSTSACCCEAMTRSSLYSPSSRSCASSRSRWARNAWTSLAIRHPDVLHARGVTQELAALGLGGVVPVAALAGVDPRGLQVAHALALDHGAALGGAEVPHGLHGVVLGQHLGELVAHAGDDVDGAGGQVGGLEHLVE